MMEQVNVNKSDLVYALLANFSQSAINSLGKVVDGKVVATDRKVGIAIVDVGLKLEGVIPLKEFFQLYHREDLVSLGAVHFVHKLLQIADKENIIKINKNILDTTDKSKYNILAELSDAVTQSRYTDAEVIFNNVLDMLSFPLHEKDFIFTGYTTQVYIASLDSYDGKKMLSREKAIREESFQMLKHKMENNETVYGITFAKVKGGLFVDFNGFIAFLPGSQIDEVNVKDVSYLMGVKHAFKVVSIDEEAKSVIVSRRAIIDENYKDARDAFYASTQEGSIITGVVKNITDYGAFIDLGCGLDGLLHLTDISWSKISHPSELLTIGQKIEAKVTKCDKATNKVTLSMKHATENSWLTLVKDFEVGQIINGKVTNIADYGIFLAIAPEVEGLIHVSEISWERDAQKYLKNYNIDNVVSAMILSIDLDKRRISLSIRMISDNPYKKFAAENIPNDMNNILHGTVAKVTDYHMYVSIGEIDGIVSMEDVAWTIDQEAIVGKYKVGTPVDVVYLGTDEKFTRIKLGIKQLHTNPFTTGVIKNNQVVTCVIVDVKHDKIIVDCGNNVLSHIKRFDLSRDKADQRTDRFIVGDKVDAKVISISDTSDQFASRRIALSIKDLEDEKYRQLLSQYGSNDTGASIADILGMKFENIKEDK